jgi:hypothetical protein
MNQPLRIALGGSVPGDAAEGDAAAPPDGWTTDGRVYALPADCGASAAPCEPAWVSADLDLPLFRCCPRP